MKIPEMVNNIGIKKKPFLNNKKLINIVVRFIKKLNFKWFKLNNL